MFRKYVLIADHLPASATYLSTAVVSLARLRMHILYLTPGVDQTLQRLLPGFILEEASEVRAYAGEHRDRLNQRALPLDGVLPSNERGQGVPVYVLDTGVNPHEELGERLKPGYNVTSSGGLLLGLVPLPSRQRVDNKDTADRQGHGTHVAGLVAGRTTGTSQADIVPVKVLGDSGSGSTDGILQGIDWIMSQPVGVVNASLGGSVSETLDEGFRRLQRAGYTVVVAAGNENRDVSRSSPARVQEIISVGAIDAQDQKASFSNFGMVDIWAPGVDITSSWMDGGYRSLSGTSMAAPIVAGLLTHATVPELLARSTRFPLGLLAYTPF